MYIFPYPGNGYIEADELNSFMITLLQETGNEVNINTLCTKEKGWILANKRYLMATKICFNLIFLIKDNSQKHDVLTKFKQVRFLLKIIYIVGFSVLFLKTMLYFWSWIVVYDEYINGFILIRSYRSNFKVHKIVTKRWVGINYQFFCLNFPWKYFK